MSKQSDPHTVSSRELPEGGVRSPALLPLIILLSGLLVFCIFAFACRSLYQETEQRLLQQRTDEAAAALTISVSQLQTPLDAAVTLATLTDGDPQAFADAMQDLVGGEGTYSSAMLFSIDSTTPVATAGLPSVLEQQPNGVQQLLDLARTESFIIIDLLDQERHLGYSSSGSGDERQYVVYAERILSADPNVRRRNDEPFAQLDYAIYLNDASTSHLLGASTPSLPFEGRQAEALLPFGDQQMLLVMTPIGHLSSNLFANLWWIVGLIGAIASVTVAGLSRRLITRRNQALDLAVDNERLYDQQRQIAETLQLSLLPQVLQPPPGAEVAARYWPAGTASLIGGDFYDVFRVDDNRSAITIGDVCGKGIEAAAVTGLARHTVRAASRHSTSAAEVLHSVHLAMAEHRPPTFCTVCFLYIETAESGAQQITLSLGGHPPALLRHADGSVEEVGELGTLLGLVEPMLSDVTVPVSAGDTLVLYTDGLTDAPAEQAVPIHEVVQLLQTDGDQDPEQLADSIRQLKRRRRPRGSADDTVVLVVRFGAAGLTELSEAGAVQTASGH